VDFREYLLRIIVEPMIAGAIDENGQPIALSATAASGPRYPAYLRDVDHYDIEWVTVSTGSESCNFAIGTAAMTLEELNCQVALMSDGLDDWLSETAAYRGQQCHVPCPTVTEFRPLQ
jgi:hypothetical protein